MKIFLIACEPSGDSHGAHLVSEIKKLSPGSEFYGLGGPKMESEGVRLITDMTKISALGLGDVLRQYGTYRKIFDNALAEVDRFKPDALVLIDSPAFNLRFAKKIRKRYPVIYYISPQLWAWGGQRIHTVKQTVSKMLVILPFETEIYEKAGVECEFIGHPLLDQKEPSSDRASLRKQFEIPERRRAVGLLPGSRESEVRRILPLMLQSAVFMQEKMNDLIFFLTQSPNVPDAVYDEILKHYPALPVRRSKGKMRELTAAMDFALIASGTATLEAALIGTPFFLLYKASWTTYFLGQQLIRVKYLGMVNLLAGKSVVPEFIQHDIHPHTIAHEAQVLLDNPELYEGMKREFRNVREMLGDAGASARAAKSILEFISRREKSHEQVIQ